MQSVPLLVRRRARDQVAGLVRDLIRQGALAAGAHLDEIGLSRRIGVSRTPLREALIGLEQEGLVRSEPNKGFRVIDLNQRLVREVFPILAALEAMAVGLGGPRLIALAPELNALNQALASADDPARQYEFDTAFHVLLARECGNERLIKLIETHRNQSRMFDGAHARGTADQRGSCAEHAAIAAAIGQGKLDKAADLLIAHWRRGEDTVITWLKEVT